MRIATGLLAMLVSLPSAAPALQDVRPDSVGADTSAGRMSSLLQKLNDANPAGTPPTGVFGLSSDCAGFGDDSTKAKCWRAYQEYFDYYQSGFSHRRKVFWWQHLSSRIIFVVVLVLVSAGILFAWMQFRKDLVAMPVPGLPSAAVHQMEIGKTGVKVSSPVLGVIILVISLAFFYLYLVFVYPIKEIL